MDRWILSIILLFISSATIAAEQEVDKIKAEKTKKPVQEAPKVKQGYVPQSEITISESKDTLIKEYRIEGKLRAIKVTPKNGMPAYYLVDREGNGEFVKLGPDMGPEIQGPQWILFEW
ncbi:MAG: DUF2782 domain-containing protein [Gammaproteobacteria bacterium]|nr:MAG: DUF2782 domain-containing protein [Gammaproteobacteria bacterium]